MKHNTSLGATTVVVSTESGEPVDWGEDALITPVGRFRLVHLDDPDEATVARRVAQFDPDDFLVDGCLICRELREQGGDVVYDERDPAEMALDEPVNG